MIHLSYHDFSPHILVMSPHNSIEQEYLLKVLTVISNTTGRESYTAWTSQARLLGDNAPLFASDRGKGSLFEAQRQRYKNLER